MQSQLEWNGEAYHRLSDMQYTLGVELLSQLDLAGDEDLLDAGCGSGRLTQELLARVPRGTVLGVDLSESMLQTARREVQAAPAQKVRFVHEDLQTYVQPRSVDGVFSNMALHFIPDMQTLLTNLWTTLRPGGWLAVQLGRSQERQLTAVNNVLTLLREPPYAKFLRSRVFDFHGSEPGTLEQYLQRAGFKDIRIDLMEAPMSGAHWQKMMEFFATTTQLQCLQLLPEDMHASFSKRMSETLRASYDGTFQYLRVQARVPSLD